MLSASTAGCSVELTGSLYELEFPPICANCGNATDQALPLEKAFDGGDSPLRIARYCEPFALLVGQLAYEGKGGPELAYRFERFKP